ncbi:hypothetical protein XCR_1519 [Xanthomonas campestris pv. raphani 756C]|nr:hypothetical protein XCR_1519 [Xanthomonas campestris pv. raphani 756C]
MGVAGVAGAGGIKDLNPKRHYAVAFFLTAAQDRLSERIASAQLPGCKAIVLSCAARHSSLFVG